MPRPLRKLDPAAIYHVLNRGNGRQPLFAKDGDFLAFLTILAQGLERYPVDLLAYCLMGNHWHLLLRPRTAAALPDLIRWVTTTHARRLHAHLGGRRRRTESGHVYQGRYKSFPVQPDDWHFLAVARYVEGNPLRAKLVRRAQDWRWSSLTHTDGRRCGLSLADWPALRPPRWASIVNGTWDEEGDGEKPHRGGGKGKGQRKSGRNAKRQGTLATIRESVTRGRPFGDATWSRRTAQRHGLQSALRPIGRPPKPLNALSPRQRRRRLKRQGEADGGQNGD